MIEVIPEIIRFLDAQLLAIYVANPSTFPLNFTYTTKEDIAGSTVCFVAEMVSFVILANLICHKWTSYVSLFVQIKSMPIMLSLSSLIIITGRVDFFF